MGKLGLFLLSILTLGLLLSLSAQAETSIQTAVDQNSGEELFACNASIRHPSLDTEPECLSLSTGEVCSPNQVKYGDDTCVCRTKKNFGDQIMAWDLQDKYQSAIGGESWMSLIDPLESFGNRLSRIDINLGSENLGAEYSMRFCYLGPQEIKSKDKDSSSDLSEGKYQVELSLAGTNYSKAIETLGFTYQCDYRNTGSETQARKKNEDGPKKGILEVDGADSLNLYTKGPQDPPETFNFLRRAITLNLSASQVPRFCVFDIKFKELSGARLFRDAKTSNGDFRGTLRICKQGECPSTL